MPSERETSDNPSTPRETFHQVWVPELHLIAVYGFLHELGRGIVDDAEAGSVRTASVAGEVVWSSDDLRALWARCNARTRAMVTAVAEATVNGSEVSYGELLEIGRQLANDAQPYGENNLRADLAWISKHSNKVKPGAGWPLTFRQQPHGGPGEHLLYTMPATAAAAWLAMPASQ